MKKIKDFIDMFTKISTGIIIFASIYIYIFWGADEILSVFVIWGILICAFFCTLGSILIFSGSSDREPTKSMQLLRQILCFAYNNVITLLCGFFFEWFRTDDWKMIAGIELCVIIVYFFVTIVTYMADVSSAAKMNSRLHDRDNG